MSKYTRALLYADVAFKITARGVRVIKVRNDPPGNIPPLHAIRVLVEREFGGKEFYAYGYFSIREKKTALAKWVRKPKLRRY